MALVLSSEQSALEFVFVSFANFGRTYPVAQHRSWKNNRAKKLVKTIGIHDLNAMRELNHKAMLGYCRCLASFFDGLIRERTEGGEFGGSS